MRIVVSGTNTPAARARWCPTSRRPCGYAQLPDPYELVDDDATPAGAASFVRQLLVAAERLVALARGADVVAERGPVDLLAYLEALAELGRPSVGPDLMARLRATAGEAMAHVDLLVVVPLDAA